MSKHVTPDLTPEEYADLLASERSERELQAQLGETLGDDRKIVLAALARVRREASA